LNSISPDNKILRTDDSFKSWKVTVDEEDVYLAILEPKKFFVVVKTRGDRKPIWPPSKKGGMFGDAFFR